MQAGVIYTSALTEYSCLAQLTCTPVLTNSMEQAYAAWKGRRIPSPGPSFGHRYEEVRRTVFIKVFCVEAGEQVMMNIYKILESWCEGVGMAVRCYRVACLTNDCIHNRSTCCAQQEE